MRRVPRHRTGRTAKQLWSAKRAADVRFASPHPRLIALETRGRYRPSMTPLLTVNDKMVKPGFLPRPRETGQGPRCSAVDDGDRFDLDHRVGVGQPADLDRRAGRRGVPEVAHPHIGVLGELRVIGDVGIGLDDVGQGGADGFEAGLDVLADLLDLGAHITLANAHPLRVARQLASNEDHLAGAADGDDVGVPGLAVDHADMDALRLNLLAFDRHLVPFPYNAPRRYAARLRRANRSEAPRCH